jgi:MFS family permease
MITRRLPPLLQSRVFRHYWGAQSVSMLGDQVTGIALPLTAILTLDASPTQMGVLTAVVWLPYPLLALHAGLFADRRSSRRRLMIACDIGRALLLMSVPIASAVGILGLPQLYVVAFAAGCFSVLFNVADSALFVAIVERSRFMAANSLGHGSRAFSYLAGPSLGGLLVQAVSAPFALFVDALSFLCSAALLGSVTPQEPPPEPPQPGQLTAGIRFIRNSPVLAYSLASTTWVNLFTFAFSALFLLFASRSLHLSAGTIGLVMGVAAVGGLIGSAVTSTVSGRIGIGPAFCLGSLVFPAPLVLVPLAEGHSHSTILLFLFLAEFISATGVMMLDITGGTIAATLVPAALRARVSGAYTIVNYGVRPVGALAGGLMGEALGTQTALWISAIGGCLSVLWLLPSPLLTLRKLPEVPE